MNGDDPVVLTLGHDTNGKFMYELRYASGFPIFSVACFFKQSTTYEFASYK